MEDVGELQATTWGVVTGDPSRGAPYIGINLGDGQTQPFPVHDALQFAAEIVSASRDALLPEPRRR